ALRDLPETRRRCLRKPLVERSGTASGEQPGMPSRFEPSERLDGYVLTFEPDGLVVRDDLGPDRRPSRVRRRLLLSALTQHSRDRSFGGRTVPAKEQQSRSSVTGQVAPRRVDDLLHIESRKDFFDEDLAVLPLRPCAGVDHSDESAGD